MQIPQLHLVSEEAGDRGSCRVRRPNCQQYGVQPNPAYLQGIRDFPASKTISELRSFLGMVNHLSAYHPKIARHTGVLQALLKKNTSFLWLEDQQAAFDRLKSDLLSALSLNHFDPSWSKRLVTDASRLHGLGFVLMQHQDDKKKGDTMRIQVTITSREELFHSRIGTDSNRMGHPKMQLLPQRD